MDVVEAKDRSAEGRPEGQAEGLTVDLRGLKCPMPALRTQKALARTAAGATIEVLADDPLARLDIAHLCRAGGHDLLSVEPLEAGGWRFVIRRADAG